MIVLVAEYPCVVCGRALCMPTPLRPERLPATIVLELTLDVPDGWTYDTDGVHCPAHPPSRLVPAVVIPPGVLKGT